MTQFKKNFVLTAAVLAGSVGISNAAMTISLVKTGTYSGFDEIAVTLTGLSATDANTKTIGTQIRDAGLTSAEFILNTTGTVAAGPYISTPGGSAFGASANKTNGGNSHNPPVSFIKLDSAQFGVIPEVNGNSTDVATTVDFLGVTSTFGYNPTGGGAHVNGNQITPTGAPYADGGSLIGDIYVTAGAGFTYTVNGNTLSGGHPTVSGTYAPAGGGDTTTAIISLTGAVPSAFGSLAGTVTPGATAGGYTGGQISIASTGKAYVATNPGFTNAGDQEIYGLTIAKTAGAGTLATDLTNLETALNTAGKNMTLDSGLHAYTAADLPSNIILPPGFGTSSNLFIVAANGVANTTPNLGFDLTTLQGANTSAGITDTLQVTAVAAVPEPATVAAVVVSAAGLLVGRRRRRVA